jgi:hypothetical protein
MLEDDETIKRHLGSITIRHPDGTVFFQYVSDQMLQDRAMMESYAGHFGKLWNEQWARIVGDK